MKNLYPQDIYPHVLSYWLDDQGRIILRIRLGKGPHSTITTADEYDRLTGVDLTRMWYADADKKGGRPYVRTFLPDGRLVTVARLIARAGDGEVVKYRNGDRFDLRPENLHVIDGWSKYHAEGDFESAHFAKIDREEAEAASMTLSTETTQ